MALLCQLALLCVVLLAPTMVRAQEDPDLDFLTNIGEFRDLRKMLPAHLMNEADQHLQQRAAVIAGMSTLDAMARRKLVWAKILESIGGLPERAPLNPRIVGVIDRGDYKIEKIIFESQPQFFVTGNLYLPKTGTPPYPAILYPLGHELGGKSNSTWQQMLGSLARRGYVAFAWDPLGQEERKQFFDPDWNDSKFFSSTVEHTELGTQCMLIGDAVARYTIWDRYPRFGLPALAARSGPQPRWCNRKLRRRHSYQLSFGPRRPRQGCSAVVLHHFMAGSVGGARAAGWRAGVSRLAEQRDGLSRFHS
jgi:hypothetical protein